jgi:hypothetical protein
MANDKNPKQGSEVARDAARDDHGPKQHGREWGEAVDDSKRPPPSDEGLQRETKVTREKYGTPKPDEN